MMNIFQCLCVALLCFAIICISTRVCAASGRWTSVHIRPEYNKIFHLTAPLYGTVGWQLTNLSDVQMNKLL